MSLQVRREPVAHGLLPNPLEGSPMSEPTRPVPEAPAGRPVEPGERLSDPPFELPETVELQEGVVFARPAGLSLRLDLFMPRTRSAPARGIVYLHGGGWRGGSRRQFWRQAAHLATRGCIGACIEYRLAPAATFPAQLEDAQEAVRWLRRRAGELGIDPSRIGAVGGSAGGHLAALLGTTDAPVDGLSSRVQAVVAFNGVFDLTPLLEAPEQPRSAVLGLLGGRIELAITASAYHQADARAAPALLLHGTADQVVPFEQSRAYAARLRALGVRAELYAEPGAGHGFFNRTPYYQRTLPVIERFLLEAL